MADLRELYQEMILDHGKDPRNFHALDRANRKAEGFNPLCGDKVTLYALVEDGVIADVSFQGSGCAISQASASLLTETLRGKSTEEAGAISSIFLEMLTGEPGQIPDIERLDKLAVFSGVSEFPMRVKCATLAWHTLRSALDRRDDAVTITVTTE